MSIATRIEAIEEHIGDIYDTLTLGGADLTGINKNLVNVTSQLKDRYLDFMNNGTWGIWNNCEKVTGEGTSLSLSPTIQAPMKNILKGNTSQTGTPTPSSPIPVNVVSGDNEIVVCGKNICFTDFGDWESGEYNSSGNKGNNTSRVRTKDLLIVRQSTTYFLDTSSSNDSFIVREYDKNKTFIKNDGIITNGGTITTMSNCYFLGITLFSNANQTRSYDTYQTLFEESTIKPFICLNSVSNKTYEPYIGNTYNIDLPVENLFDKETLHTGDITGVYTTTRICDYQAKYLETGTYTFSSDLTSTYRYYITINDSGTRPMGSYPTYSYNSGWVNDTTKTFTITTPGYFTLTIARSDNGTITLNDIKDFNYQLEKGSKANSYTPYGTTPIELCKMENYQDYIYKDSDKWYLHKEIGKELIDVSVATDWGFINTSFQSSAAYPSDIVDISSSISALSNNFKYHYYASGITTNLSNGEFGWNSGKKLTFKMDGMTSKQNYIDWFTSNTTYVYYQLATPTNTEITYGPLIYQLEAWYQAKSKNGQTNISQINNDLPFIINSTMLKEV